MESIHGAESPSNDGLKPTYLRNYLDSPTFQFLVSLITSIFSVIDTILIGVGIDLPATHRRMGYSLGGLGGRLARLVAPGPPKGDNGEYELQSESGAEDGVVEGSSSAVRVGKGSRMLRMRRSVPVDSKPLGV